MTLQELLDAAEVSELVETGYLVALGIPLNTEWKINQVQSMNYILVQNVFMSVSGGYCILKSSRKEERFGRDYEPLILTLDEVRDLRKGVVPDSLKAE